MSSGVPSGSIWLDLRRRGAPATTSSRRALGPTSTRRVLGPTSTRRALDPTSSPRRWLSLGSMRVPRYAARRRASSSRRAARLSCGTSFVGGRSSCGVDCVVAAALGAERGTRSMSACRSGSRQTIRRHRRRWLALRRRRRQVHDRAVVRRRDRLLESLEIAAAPPLTAMLAACCCGGWRGRGATARLGRRHPWPRPVRSVLPSDEQPTGRPGGASRRVLELVAADQLRRREAGRVLEIPLEIELHRRCRRAGRCSLRRPRATSSPDRHRARCGMAGRGAARDGSPLPSRISFIALDDRCRGGRARMPGQGSLGT